MRKEEIVPLTKNDIDLINKTISINKAVTFVHNQPVLKSTKNKRTRFVPILDITYDLVKNLVSNTDCNLLFTKDNVNRFSYKKTFRKFLIRPK